MESVYKNMFKAESGILSLLGGGGKTTLMFRLAGEMAESGRRVLTTTSTKIFMPNADESEQVVLSKDLAEVEAEARRILRTSRHLTAARRLMPETGKLEGFDGDEVCRLWETGLFDWIIVEADGSARRPLKAPATHEPVIPACTTHAVALVGLSVMGRPLDDESVFRAAIFSEVTGLAMGSPVTERAVADIILHASGLMKGCPAQAERWAFLNQADDEAARAAGRRIAEILLKPGPGPKFRAAVGALKQKPLFLEIYE